MTDKLVEGALCPISSSSSSSRCGLALSLTRSAHDAGTSGDRGLSTLSQAENGAKVVSQSSSDVAFLHQLSVASGGGLTTAQTKRRLPLFWARQGFSPGVVDPGCCAAAVTRCCFVTGAPATSASRCSTSKTRTRLPVSCGGVLSAEAAR